MELLGRSFDDIEIEAWFNEKPDCIKELVRRCPPGALMVNIVTNQLMQIVSWCEDGTVKAAVMMEQNSHLSNVLEVNFAVFGLNPNVLTFYCWIDDGDKIGEWRTDAMGY